MGKSCFRGKLIVHRLLTEQHYSKQESKNRPRHQKSQKKTQAITRSETQTHWRNAPEHDNKAGKQVQGFRKAQKKPERQRKTEERVTAETQSSTDCTRPKVQKWAGKRKKECICPKLTTLTRPDYVSVRSAIQCWDKPSVAVASCIRQNRNIPRVPFEVVWGHKSRHWHIRNEIPHILQDFRLGHWKQENWGKIGETVKIGEIILYRSQSHTPNAYGIHIPLTEKPQQLETKEIAFG